MRFAVEISPNFSVPTGSVGARALLLGMRPRWAKPDKLLRFSVSATVSVGRDQQVSGGQCSLCGSDPGAPPQLQRTHTHTHTHTHTKKCRSILYPQPKKKTVLIYPALLSTMWNMNPFTYPVAGFVLTFCDVKVASPLSCMLLTSICLGLFFQLHAFQIFRMWFLSFSLDSTESLWGIICKELFLIVGLDEAIASGQMKLIQNELDCIEESGYAKFLAIEITRARYALQVSANSYDKIIPLPYLFKVYYRQQTKFAKVMFLHVSVILSGGGGGGGIAASSQVSRPTPRGELEGSGRGGLRVSQHALKQTPPTADGYCYGQYASYWNAFLLWLLLHKR